MINALSLIDTICNLWTSLLEVALVEQLITIVCVGHTAVKTLKSGFKILMVLLDSWTLFP